MVIPRVPLGVLLMLGAVTAFGPLSIDMYLPALPAIADNLGSEIGHAQQTLTAYFIGLAAGQLFYGPVADRYGRRIPLITGMLLFSLASLACALADDMAELATLRVLQALGGAAGGVISRAVVRDLVDHRGAARAFSTLALIMGAAPIVAPFLGSYVLLWAGWRAIFWLLGGLALLCTLLIWARLPESHHADARLSLPVAFRQYGLLLRDSRYLAYAVCGGSGLAGMFTYITSSPFVFIELYQVPVEHYGWLFGSNAACFILAANLNGRLVARFHPDRILLGGTLGMLLFSLGMLVVALAGGGLGMLLPMLFGFSASVGLIGPNATAGALAGHGERAGSASALFGALQFGLAALAASAVGGWHDGTLFPTACLMLVCALASCGARLGFVRSH